jgi:c-di-GMP-binding flagellar brake protein YcgR
MGFVKEWLQNHIGEEDKRIADHIRKPGTIWDAANGVQLRKHPRYPVSFPLTYVLDGNPFVKRGRARDISGGGIHLESDESVPENTSMTISFELRPELNVEVRGRPVVNYYANGRHRHRIAFSTVSDAVRDSIVTFVYEAWRTDVLSS